MDTLRFDFVTPEATFFSGPATLVEIPGTLGDFGVLPGHMNFISTLRPGVVTVHADGAAATRIFVQSGIAEVNPESCTVLAERIVDLTALTRAEAETRLSSARAALESAVGDAAIDARIELEIAEAILLAV